MTRKQMNHIATVDLIEAYCVAAREQGAATESGDFKKGNRASDRLAAIYKELQRRGEQAQQALLPLLADEDPGVRLWSASHALEFSPSDAVPVLQSLIPIGRFLGLCAKTTLQEWRKGQTESSERHS